MKLLILLVFVLAISISANAQSSEPIIGKFNYEEWMNQTKWTVDENNKYIPSDSVIKLLGPIVKEQKISFIIFAGSWCGDTKSELPKIISVLKSLDIDVNTVPIYGVDRDKYEPTFTSKRMMIKKVPTIIITYQNEEMSRIEEFPVKGSTWELDILRIFQ